jgi:hypothetical protein
MVRTKPRLPLNWRYRSGDMRAQYRHGGAFLRPTTFGGLIFAVPCSPLGWSRLDYLLVTEALREGLLRAIVSSATHNIDDVNKSPDYFLSNLPPAFSIYRSVLISMDRAPVNVEELANTDLFRTSCIFPR